MEGRGRGGERGHRYPGSVQGIVENGEYGLIQYFMEECKQQMVTTCRQNKEWEEIKAYDKLKLLMQARIKFLGRYREQWATAMAIGLQPEHLKTTAAHLVGLVDTFVEESGIETTQFSQHPIRASLLFTSISSGK